MLEDLPTEDATTPPAQTNEDLARDYHTNPERYGPLGPHVEAYLARNGVPLPTGAETDATAEHLHMARELGSDALEAKITTSLDESANSFLKVMGNENQSEEDPIGRALNGLTDKLVGSDNVYMAAYDIAEALADNEPLVDALVERSKQAESNDWERACLRICVDRAADVKKSRVHAQEIWGDTLDDPEADEAAKAAAQRLEKVQSTIQLKNDFYKESSTSTLRQLVGQYGRFSKEGVTVDDVDIFCTLNPNSRYGSEASAEDITQASRTYQSLSEGVKGMIGFDDNDPKRIIAIAPLIDKLVVAGNSEESEAIAREQRRALAQITGSRNYTDPETSRQATEAVEVLANQGVSVERIIDFLPDQAIAQQFGAALEAKPGSPQTEQAVGLIVAVANLPLFNGPSKELEAGQSRFADIRQCIIDEVFSEPEAYAGYIDLLNQKLPILQQAGFPLPLIRKSVLQEFNPAGNMETEINLGHASSSLDYCAQLGNSISELADADPELLKRILDRQLYDLRKGPAEVSATALAQIGHELMDIKKEHPELYEWVSDAKYSRLYGASDIEKYLVSARQLLLRPALLNQALEIERERGMRIDSKSARVVHDMVEHAATTDEVNEFFAKYDQASDLAEDTRLDSAGILGAIRHLDQQGLEKFTSQLRAPATQEALQDPELREQINTALLAMYVHIESADLPRAITEYRKLSDTTAFPIHRIMSGVHNLSSRQLTDTYYETIAKSSAMHDKDGNPYEGPLEIAGVLDSVFRTRQHNLEVLHSDIEWFQSSGIPFTAMPSLVTMRHEATTNGIDDDPRSIYKWLHGDPERIKSLSSKNTEQYIVYLAGEEEASEILTTARQQAAERRDSFRAFINISETALNSVIKGGGRIRTIFDQETDVDRPQIYEIRRSGVEIALGIRSLDGDSEHPIYGSCGFVDQTIPEGAVGYGEIMLTFKLTPELSARTTFTPEDSFHGTNILTLEDAATIRMAKDMLGKGHTTTSDYVESQILGGVELDQVDAIYVTTEGARDRLISQLDPEIARRVAVRKPQN